MDVDYHLDMPLDQRRDSGRIRVVVPMTGDGRGSGDMHVSLDINLGRTRR